jgi:hypothetical protein
MKASVKKMVKDILKEGFHKGHYAPLLTDIRYPHGGIFSNPQDIKDGYHIASLKLVGWREQARAGNSPVPSSKEEFERFLDINIAESSFQDAYTLINRRFSSRSNADLVKEMRADIEELRNYGCSEKVSLFEYMLKQRIGEE